MKNAISGNVRKIIIERGLKQKAVAKNAGYDEKQFSNMLNGRKTITDVDVFRLSVALGVTPNELFFGCNSQNSA